MQAMNVPSVGLHFKIRTLVSKRAPGVVRMRVVSTALRSRGDGRCTSTEQVWKKANPQASQVAA